MLDEHLYSIQGTINYKFHNLDLLVQALTRKSFTQEHGGDNNEVLEFLGDKALDLAIMMDFHDRFCKMKKTVMTIDDKVGIYKFMHSCYDEGQFTQMKADLVNKKALANAMDRLGFQDYLIMGEGDKKLNIKEQKSVKEDLFEAILGAVAVDCKFNFTTIRRVVNNMLDLELEIFEDEFDEESSEKWLLDWSRKHGYEHPDYVITGNKSAGYECGVNIGRYGASSIVCETQREAREMAADSLRETLEYIDQNDALIKKLFSKIDLENPVGQLNKLYQNGLIQEVEFEYLKPQYDENGNPIWTVAVNLFMCDDAFVGKGASKSEAKKVCAIKVLEYLFEKFN